MRLLLQHRSRPTNKRNHLRDCTKDLTKFSGCVSCDEQRGSATELRRKRETSAVAYSASHQQRYESGQRDIFSSPDANNNARVQAMRNVPMYAVTRAIENAMCAYFPTLFLRRRPALLFFCFPSLVCAAFCDSHFRNSLASFKLTRFVCVADGSSKLAKVVLYSTSSLVFPCDSPVRLCLNHGNFRVILIGKLVTLYLDFIRV